MKRMARNMLTHSLTHLIQRLLTADRQIRGLVRFRLLGEKDVACLREVALRLSPYRDRLVETWVELYRQTFGAGRFLPEEEARRLFQGEIDNLLSLLDGDSDSYLGRVLMSGEQLADRGVPFDEMILSLQLFEQSCMRWLKESGVGDETYHLQREAIDALSHNRLALLAHTYFYRIIREYHERTLSALPVALCVLEGAQRIRLVNRAFYETFGLEQAEVEGHRIAEVLPIPALLEAVRSSGGGGDALRHLSCEHASPRHGALTLTVTIADFQLEEGDGQRVLLLFEDTTERRRMEQERERLRVQLLQADKLAALGQLVAGIAHELNNPLTSVLGYAQLAAERKGCGEEVRRDLGQIIEGAERAARIVKSLLLFVRAEKPEKRPVGVNGVLESVLDLMADPLRADGMTVHRALIPNESLPKALGDYHQLQQVFLNLIHNACQAMASLKRPGELTVKTECLGGKIRVSIADTGPGIPKADLPRIFDPFFTTKPVGQGTGLGLSVGYGIVQEHGGRIWAESEEGQGATFIVELPVASGVEEVETAPAAAPPVAAAPSYRVLVVDDEPAICWLCYRLFSQMGHQPDLAHSGQEAFRKLEQAGGEGYDLLFLDMKMPGTGGREIYRHLLQRYPRLASRVVFATGDTVSKDTADFLAETGRPALAKPFTLEDLRRVIQRVVVGP
jgi:PAS domain S-box-containing protein